MRSTALTSNISLSNSSAITTLEVLQGLMDGLGWHNLSSSIHQADAKQKLADQELATAIQFYSEEQNAHTRTRLITALNETLQSLQAEYDHAIKQQHYYQKQAKVEAEQKSASTSTYLGQWSYWVFDGIKTFFGSTTEQQIEKYQQLAASQLNVIHNISVSLAILHKENKHTFSLDSAVNPVKKNSPMQGQFPAVIYSKNLDAKYGFEIFTPQGSEFVSEVGDINKDGYSDIGFCNSIIDDWNGDCYVIFGGSNISKNGIVNVTNLNGMDGFKIHGIEGQRKGIGQITSAGDFNADGFNDVLIGATNDLACYVIFGKYNIGNGGLFNLSNINGTNGVNFIRDDSDSYRYPGGINTIGDINADGNDDIIIGTTSSGSTFIPSEKCYAIFGGSQIGSSRDIYLKNISNSNGTLGFVLYGDSRSEFGAGVSSLDDINSDGYIDFIINAPALNNFTGRSYIVFGDKKIGLGGIYNLTSLNGTNGFMADGEMGNRNDGQYFYQSVRQLGDINGDSYNDFIIGYPSDGTGSGRAYVIFGSPNVGKEKNLLNLANLNGTNGFKIVGNGISDPSLASVVSGNGDINGDNYKDLIIGSFGISSTFIIFGNENVGEEGFFNISELNGKNGFKFIANGNKDFYCGGSVSNLDDINGDKVSDLIIGCPNQGNNNAYVIFGDIPPVLVNNTLSLYRGEKILINSIFLSAFDLNHGNSSLVFSLTNLFYGSFESTTNPNVSIVSFTQQQVFDHLIQFVHDGSLNSPTYNITVRSSGIAWTGPIAAEIIFNPAPIILINNQLIINQSQSIQLTTMNLLAICNNVSDLSLKFTITNITHGSFIVEGHIVQSSLVSFPQQAINSKSVSFIQDGSPYTPTYQVSVSDSWIQAEPVFANITFNTMPFLLINNQLNINQNGTLLLTSKELLATRNSYADPTFKLVVTNISHGFFIVNQQKSDSQITFTQQAILSGNVSFTQDGSTYSPKYWVAVNDGWNQTDPQAANITFFLKPVLAINQFLVALGQSTLLSLNNLCANDCYDDEFDELQFNLVGDVTSGQFENISASGKALTRFTQKNVKQNQIKFVSNGMAEAPRYTLAVTDPITLLNDSSIGSTLLVARNYLPINQNQIFYLTTENLNVTSSSGLDTDIIFSPIVNTVKNGYFSLASDTSVPIATFKQDQINKNLIAFVPDGSSNDPSCILSVRDGQSTGASGSFACSIDFASYPRLDHAFLKISPPDSFPLTLNNLEASDDKIPPNQLYFIVSDVQNDHFAYSSDFKKPIVNFTQTEVSAGKVYFIANSNNPPAFSVSVWNGRLYCQEDCPRAATIVAPDTGGENSLSSLWIGLLSSFGTLVLLPLVKCYFEKAIKSYFSSREDTPDSQVTNEALGRLWIGCCGVITHRQHEEYIIAFGHVIDKLNDLKQVISLRREWQHLGDRQKRAIKSAIAEKSEEVLVGGQSGFCRFFKSFCHSEATPETIERKAEQIAREVTPRLSQLFSQIHTIPQVSIHDSASIPLLTHPIDLSTS